MNKKYWGYHLIINAKAGKKDIVTSKTELTAWVKDLVRVIDMKAFGEPMVEHFGTECHLMGYTVNQMIETSTISCHLCDESGDFYLDVFSCKEFSEDDVIDQIKEWFNPVSIKSTMLLRQA